MFDAEKTLIALNKEHGEDFCAPGFALGEAVIESLREAYEQGRRDEQDSRCAMCEALWSAGRNYKCDKHLPNAPTKEPSGKED